MKFNYLKLLGRIKECGLTQKDIAESIGISRQTLSAKFNGRFSFDAEEIISISKILLIPTKEIGNYFFCVDSSET